MDSCGFSRNGSLHQRSLVVCAWQLP